MKFVILLALVGLASCRSILPGGDQARNVEIEYTYIDELGKTQKVKVQSDLINLSGIGKDDDSEFEKNMKIFTKPSESQVEFKMVELTKENPEPIVKHIFVPAPKLEPEIKYIEVENSEHKFQFTFPNPEIKKIELATSDILRPFNLLNAKNKKIKVETPELELPMYSHFLKSTPDLLQPFNTPTRKVKKIKVETPELELPFVFPSSEIKKIAEETPKLLMPFILPPPEIKKMELDNPEGEVRFVMLPLNSETVEVKSYEPEVQFIMQHQEHKEVIADPKMHFVVQLPESRSRSLNVEEPKVQSIKIEIARPENLKAKTIELELKNPLVQVPESRTIKIEEPKIQTIKLDIPELEEPETETLEFDPRSHFVVQIPKPRSTRIEEPKEQKIYIQGPAPAVVPQTIMAKAPEPKVVLYRFETDKKDIPEPEVHYITVPASTQRTATTIKTTTTTTTTPSPLEIESIDNEESNYDEDEFGSVES